MAKSVGKSIWAVFAGFVVIVILSVAADTVLKLTGVLPYDHLYVSTGLILTVIFYRAVFSFIGCYLAARLAPQNPMTHALALGVVGMAVSTAGAILAADLGPAWYNWSLVVIALPIAWFGGKWYEMRILQSERRNIRETVSN
ncbi:hypothetical protein SAMN05443144_113139 [Fodinibius roseus]|uniref:Uncharacterized protein n=1 Tax=Fodinibius roseus TaxID=1194090 RepID=A0A1M5ER08_9BACT|nr:hypothetical protein [Fodinibius roseus]SHF81695.1 hypothetical protein SAMN05443144_113139 [Fodinibius roseus]